MSKEIITVCYTKHAENTEALRAAVNYKFESCLHAYYQSCSNGRIKVNFFDWRLYTVYSLGPLYVVWQKSNETDFLLTMNFILFTNQGYPLQNSSVGQLHSDGGVVSIVRSSAGRLLLVRYLSARRLRSSGYYPKYQNCALTSGFWAGGTKRSHRDWDPANRGLRNNWNAFFLPNIHWWRLPCDMGRCRGAASKCVQCLVALVPPFT